MLDHVAQGNLPFCAMEIMSNILELRTPFQALLAFQREVQGKALLLQMDNMTAVTYIKRQGGGAQQVPFDRVKPIMN